MGQLRSDPNSVGARKTGRNSFPSEEAFLRFFLMNSFPESPLKRACLVYISTFWPESRKKKPSSLWFYIHPFISEELINTIEKMNQRSQEKGQRRQKDFFFSLLLAFLSLFWPQPYFQGKFPVTPWSVMSQHSGRKQRTYSKWNGGGEKHKAELWRYRQSEKPSKAGEASWSESEGAVWAAVLRLEACGDPWDYQRSTASKPPYKW